MRTDICVYADVIACVVRVHRIHTKSTRYILLHSPLQSLSAAEAVGLHRVAKFVAAATGEIHVIGFGPVIVRCHVHCQPLISTGAYCVI